MRVLHKYKDRREVPWQPCEWEPALQACSHQLALSHWRNFSGDTYLNHTYCSLTPMRGGKGWELNWQNRQPKQWSTKINRASKLQIWWQSSDPSKALICKDQQSRQLKIIIIIMATKAHRQALWQGKPLQPPCRSVEKTAGHNDLRLT